MNHKHVKKNMKKEKTHFGSTRGTEIPRAVTTHFSSLIIKPLYFLLFTFWGPSSENFHSEFENTTILKD